MFNELAENQSGPQETGNYLSRRCWVFNTLMNAPSSTTFHNASSCIFIYMGYRVAFRATRRSLAERRSWFLARDFQSAASLWIHTNKTGRARVVAKNHSQQKGNYIHHFHSRIHVCRFTYSCTNIMIRSSISSASVRKIRMHMSFVAA